MSSYILMGQNCREKKWWNEIVRTCAVVGDPFEIHCWSDERAEVKAALRFGHRVASTWRDGTVIQGRITKDFLSYLTESRKPQDTDIYNKMLDVVHHEDDVECTDTIAENYGPTAVDKSQFLDVQECRYRTAAKYHGNHDKDEQKVLAGEIPLAERISQRTGQEHTQRHAKRQMNKRIFVTVDDISLIDKRLVRRQLRMLGDQCEGISQIFVF